MDLEIVLVSSKYVQGIRGNNKLVTGNRFGLLGVKTGIASIISNYKLEATEKTPIPIKFELKSIVLQSSVGVPLKFVPLN